MSESGIPVARMKHLTPSGCGWYTVLEWYLVTAVLGTLETRPYPPSPTHASDTSTNAVGLAERSKYGIAKGRTFDSEFDPHLSADVTVV